MSRSIAGLTAVRPPQRGEEDGQPLILYLTKEATRVRELTKIEEAWLEALPAYLQHRACGMGICGRVQEFERLAKVAPDPEKRKAAQHQADVLKYEAQAAWGKASAWVEHLHIAEVVRSKGG